MTEFYNHLTYELSAGRAVGIVLEFEHVDVI